MSWCGGDQTITAGTVIPEKDGFANDPVESYSYQRAKRRDVIAHAVPNLQYPHIFTQ
jgi:hypothetical protein